MYQTPFYIQPIKKIARFGEEFLALKQFDGLPWRLRNAIAKIFWGGHVVWLILIFLEGPIGIEKIGLAEKGIYLFAPFWAIYFANFIFIYLPFVGFYEFFSYLADHNIPTGIAFMVTTLAFIGLAALLIMYFSL